MGSNNEHISKGVGKVFFMPFPFINETGKGTGFMALKLNCVPLRLVTSRQCRTPIKCVTIYCRALNWCLFKTWNLTKSIFICISFYVSSPKVHYVCLSSAVGGSHKSSLD